MGERSEECVMGSSEIRASQVAEKRSMGMKTCQGTDSSRLPRRAVGAAKLLKMNNTDLPKACAERTK